MTKAENEGRARVVGWWCKWPSLRNPGRRLRAELVMRGLRARGIEVEWFDKRHPERYRCVVIARRFGKKSRVVAETLRAQGCRLVLDLCDNHFIYPEHEEKLRVGAAQLRTFAAFVDHVVVASEALAEVVRAQCPDVAAVTVIGDLADDLSVIPLGALERLRGLIARRRLSRWLATDRGVRHTRLVWFGDKGGSWAQVGLPDLAAIKPLLTRLHAEFPLLLTVISNDRRKYRQLFADLSLPHAYVAWNAANFMPLLSAHDIVLIPTSVNEFTRCKTDNRVVTALNAGLAVVASPIPSYQRYAEVIALGDFEQGLRRYLAAPALRQAHVDEGRQLASRYSDTAPVIAAWQRVVEGC